jgi:pSer/pThr/pTyr-binding forkhead associated (FHA) protein
VALVLLRGDGSRRSFPLPGGTSMIGRREDCHLRIPLGEVSRRHCQIETREEALLLRDLGSSNGTYVNGRRVQESPLLAGDVLRIGTLEFLVQVDGTPEEPAAVTDEGRVAAGDLRPPGLSHLNPTAQAEAAEAADVLDPSAMAGDIEELMND